MRATVTTHVHLTRSVTREESPEPEINDHIDSGYGTAFVSIDYGDVSLFVDQPAIEVLRGALDEAERMFERAQERLEGSRS